MKDFLLNLVKVNLHRVKGTYIHKRVLERDNNKKQKEIRKTGEVTTMDDIMNIQKTELIFKMRKKNQCVDIFRFANYGNGVGEGTLAKTNWQFLNAKRTRNEKNLAY